jgi:hypothetical protein
VDITRLPGLWRTRSSQPYSRLSPSGDLQRCADELELAWHQHAHDAFDPGCRFCNWERQHNDTYPEAES